MITLYGYMEERLHGCYQSGGESISSGAGQHGAFESGTCLRRIPMGDRNVGYRKNQSDAIDKSEKAVLEIMLENAQTSDPEQEAFMLPESIDGKKVSWRQRNLTELQLLLGTLVTIVAVFFFKDRDIHELVEKKKQEEKRKYPEILQKITLYLEAGLTVRAAVNKIAEDYEQTRKKGAKEQAAYEELLIAVREIRMGVSEGAAYEKFGKGQEFGNISD